MPMSVSSFDQVEQYCNYEIFNFVENAACKQFSTFLISLGYQIVSGYYGLQVALYDLLMIWKYTLQIFNNQSQSCTILRDCRNI